MRLDAIFTPNINTDNSVNARMPDGKTLTLSQGDVVEARVIAVRDGMASLKTSDGTVFRARLDDGVALTPGSDARLLVVEQSNGAVVMSLAGADVIAAASTAQAQAQPDAVSEGILNQLALMGLSADAGTVDAARQILAALPDIPINEAAFLAASKLDPSPDVVNALHSLFSGEADAASMLDALGRLAANAGSDAMSASAAAQDTQAQGLPGVLTDGAPSAVLPADSLLAGPLVQGAPAEVLITQPDRQTRDISRQPADAKSADIQAPGTQPPPAGQAQALETAKPLDFGQWLARTFDADLDAPLLTGELLSQSPAFEGLSARSLTAIADSLSRISRSVPELDSEAELFKGIAQFTGELFLNPDNTAPEAAEKLRQMREELYVKLSYFRDAVAASGAQSKSQILEQTQRLMDHTRLLSGIEQFVCIQLPIQLGDDRRNAELYIFKKEKGGSKRIDPEDVKILLSLDLMHMGHLEAFIEVKGREVSLRFEVDSDGVASVFRDKTAKLHELLDGSGYKFTNSSVITKKQEAETTVETAQLSLLAYLQSIGGGLDFRI